MGTCCKPYRLILSFTVIITLTDSHCVWFVVIVVISQIKEIRVGRNTDILRNKEFEGSWQDACIFSVIFGDNFESLDLIANSADEANIWVTGLTYLTTSRHKSGRLTAASICCFHLCTTVASLVMRRRGVCWEKVALCTCGVGPLKLWYLNSNHLCRFDPNVQVWFENL